MAALAAPRVPVRYYVLAAFCLITAIGYLQRNSISTAESQIRADLGLTPKDSGIALGAFFWGYALCQIPAGLVAKQFGTRRSLAAFALAWSICSAAVGLPGGFFTLYLARFLFGCAQAGIFVCMAISVGHWFPTHRRAMATGFIASFQSLGGAAGGILTGWLLEPTWGMQPWDWPLIFALYGVPGVAWSAWFFHWFRDLPSAHPSVTPQELRDLSEQDGESSSVAESSASRANTVASASQTTQPHVETTPWARLAASGAMWAICGQQFFRAGAYSFFATWFPTFMQEEHRVSVRESAWMNSLPLVAVVLSGIVGGWASDALTATTNRFWGRQCFSAVVLFGSAALVWCARGIDQAWPAVLVISLGSFMASLAGPAAYAITIDIGGRHVAIVFSLMNMAGNIAAAIVPQVLPLVVGQGAEKNWNRALTMFVGIYVAAGACWLLFDARQGLWKNHSEQGLSRT